MKFCDMPYERIDFGKVKEELLGLMKAFEMAESAQEQFEIHKKYYALSDRVSTQVTLASIRHSMDTTDAFYEEEKAYYDEQVPAYSNLSVEYLKLLYHSRFREELEQIIGPVAFKNMELSFRCVNESVIPIMQEENALVTEYEKLLASAKMGKY